MIEETNEKKCILVLVPDRKTETILKIFSKHIKPGSILKTDGYPTYPKAAALSNLTHKIVNHTKGFVDEDGTHTNLIEGVWGNFKTVYRSKHGLSKQNLCDFINEFNWRKNFFNNKRNANINEAFDLIIEIIKEY
ncbi:hypothetical protein H311_01723 [Anncaliia algerae PRA109]|nr:hypothetical protein H311_01723 [Anncaliia algerae PRA109]